MTTQALATPSDAPASPRAQRNHILDLMRLAFALTVIVAHAPHILYGHSAWEPLTQMLGGRLFAGAMAVDGNVFTDESAAHELF